jgi:hypothetical protein
MHRLFAAMLALTCVVGSAPSFARAGFAHGPGFAHEPGRGGFGRNPTILFGAPAPQMPAFENRIPAPLSPPTQAPIINGPLSQPAFRGMTGIGQ